MTDPQQPLFTARPTGDAQEPPGAQQGAPPSSYPEIGFPAPGAGGSSAPHSPRSGQSNTRVTVTISAVAALLIGLVGVVAYTATRDRGDDTAVPTRASTAPTAPCSTPPVLTPDSVRMTQQGLAVQTSLSATCAAGDILSGTAFTVTVTNGGYDVAAGDFDLSASPVTIPAGGTTQRVFVFPAGMYWRPTELLANQVTMTARGGSGPTVTSSGSTQTTLTASGAAAPQNGSAETAAKAGLRDLAAADHAIVARDLENRWVPQISSKRLGLEAEGIVWADADILREHLALRQRYDQVRLVWSDDWQTFSGPSWWVTVAGGPQATPEAALGWCDAQQLDADHCYAKVISSTLGPEGTTRLQG